MAHIKTFTKIHSILVELMNSVGWVGAVFSYGWICLVGGWCEVGWLRLKLILTASVFVIAFIFSITWSPSFHLPIKMNTVLFGLVLFNINLRREASGLSPTPKILIAFQFHSYISALSCRLKRSRSSIYIADFQ